MVRQRHNKTNDKYAKYKMLSNLSFSGDKPHACNFCNKRFALPCNLKAHLKLHHSQEQLKDVPQEPVTDDPPLPSTSESRFCLNNVIPEAYRNLLYEEFHKNMVSFRLPYIFPTFEHNLTFHVNQNISK